METFLMSQAAVAQPPGGASCGRRSRRPDWRSTLVASGLQASRQIRALAGHRDTPILAMTANAYAEDRASCLAAGMNDFLGEPIAPEQTFACLLEWLERSSRGGESMADSSAPGDAQPGLSLPPLPGPR
jgi:DNA-binding response OmpR family regulator